jgi:hypothetical protein
MAQEELPLAVIDIVSRVVAGNPRGSLMDFPRVPFIDWEGAVLRDP